MISTYASVLVLVAVSVLLGQAVLCACGWRRVSWLAAPVGLALVLALCWATVRMPGHGTVPAILVAVLALGAAAFVRGRVEGVRPVIWIALPTAVVGLVALSVPFVVEGHFGILGTGFNPDMSQHLLAADRLAHPVGAVEQLHRQGYPLGPHSVVVALNKGLGVGLIQGFSGYTISVGILACLTALGGLGSLSPGRRLVGSLLVGLPYMVSSYFAQGAFKETTLALFLLAFAIGLSRVGEPGGRRRFVPLGVIAGGSVFAYSFPALIWIGGTLGFWALAELIRRRGLPDLKALAPPVALAAAAFAVMALPELGRMLDFRNFETFDPSGPGLGNLFGQISPFEAFGIWPSGDFRLSPGDGQIPAAGFYAGIALAGGLCAWGAQRMLRAGETALPAALGAALAIYAAARIGGTAYSSAKGIAMIAAPAMLVSVKPLLESLRTYGTEPPSATAAAAPAVGSLFLASVAGCSVLALANAPVGPTSYDAQLTGLRPVLSGQAAIVLASQEFLSDEHGEPYIAWELRGNQICIGEKGTARLPRGVRFVIDSGSAGDQPPYPGLKLQRAAGPYLLWRVTGKLPENSGCPLIEVRQARSGIGSTA